LLHTDLHVVSTVVQVDVVARCQFHAVLSVPDAGGADCVDLLLYSQEEIGFPLFSFFSS
jgi:hypothetical protein